MELQLTPPPAAPPKGDAAGPDELVGAAKFARAVGVSRNAVYKRLNAGTLPEEIVDRTGPTTKFWLRAGKAAWISSRDPRADLHDEAPQTGDAPEAEAPPASAAPTGESHAFRDAKTREAQVKAERAELELARMRDELRHKDEIAAAIQTVFAKIREALTDRLPTHAEDLVAAAEAGGAAAVRTQLAEIGTRTCTQLVENLHRIADSDRDFDEDMDLDG